MPRDRRPAVLPPVYFTAPDGSRHRGDPAGVRANAIRVLLAVRAADERGAEMQACRREWAAERAEAVAALDLPPRERMARRMERHATDVAELRARTLQSAAPAAGTMREERGRAVHVETVAPKVNSRTALPVE